MRLAATVACRTEPLLYITFYDGTSLSIQIFTVFTKNVHVFSYIIRITRFYKLNHHHHHHYHNHHPQNDVKFFASSFVCVYVFGNIYILQLCSFYNWLLSCYINT